MPTPLTTSPTSPSEPSYASSTATRRVRVDVVIGGNASSVHCAPVGTSVQIQPAATDTTANRPGVPVNAAEMPSRVTPFGRVTFATRLVAAVPPELRTPTEIS